jgi:hypothetical protein
MLESCVQVLLSAPFYLISISYQQLGDDVLPADI